MTQKEHFCIAVTKSNMGGAQKYVIFLAQKLSNQGNQVTVLAGGDGLLFEELSKNNIPYIKLNQSQRDVSLIKEIKLVFELYKILKKINPTQLHLNSSKLGGVGAFVGRLVGIKEIVFIAHGWAFNEERPKWQKILVYFFCWITILLSTKTICVSKQTQKQISFLPFIKNKLKLEYTEIPTPNFYSREESRKILSEKFNFLNLNKKWIVVLAELHLTKGHDILFEAVEPIKDKLKDYQIVCIGSGEREDELKNIVEEKNIFNLIFFTGFLKDASNYLKAFELLILPSRTEALPLALLEAKLAQIPIIASNVGGIPEIITSDEYGQLFEKENPIELREKIKNLLEV